MRNAQWALAYTGLVLVLTLMPGSEIVGPAENVPSALCLVCGERGGADGILNLLFFVPLGFALMAATGRPVRAAVLMLVLSVAIEVAQSMIPGRYAVVGDVVYNTVGGCAGISLAAVREQLLRPSRRLAGALTLGTGTAAAATFLLAGFLLAPSFPDTVYWGQWTADLHHLETYEGQVLEASLGAMPLRSRRTSDPEGAVDLLRSGAPVRTTFVAGPPPPALAPIVSIFDEFRSEILVVGADRTDLVLRVRYRANDFRLDRPDLRVRDAFRAALPGDTLRLRAEKVGKSYAVSLNEQEYAPLRHTPGEGWTLLLHPEHTAPWVDAVLNWGWVAGLLILAGWWAPGLGWAAGALSLALTGMVVAAVRGPLVGIATVEVLAAVAGVAIGYALRVFRPKGSPSPSHPC